MTQQEFDDFSNEINADIRDKVEKHSIKRTDVADFFQRIIIYLLQLFGLLPARWVQDVSTPIGGRRSHFIDGVEYDFIALVDGVTSEPSLINEEWAIIAYKPADVPVEIIPYGNPGDFLRIVSENNLKTEEVLHKGNFTETDEELATAKGVFIDQSVLFLSWRSVVHGGMLPPASNQTPGKLAQIPSLPGVSNTWAYDSALDLVKSTLNSGPYNSLVSPNLSTDYIISTTFSSTAADNDFIGIVIAFYEDFNDMVTNNAYGLSPTTYPRLNVVDPLIPQQYTLIMARRRSFMDSEYYIIYNAGRLDQETILNGTELLSYIPTSNWNRATEGVDVKVVREGNIIKTYTSDYSDAPNGKGELGYELILDLSSDPKLAVFKNPTSYGFVTESQPDASFENIVTSDNQNKIYHLPTGDVWIADYLGEYTIDTSTSIKNEILPNSFVFNPVTSKLFYFNKDYSFYQLNAGPAPVPVDSTYIY